MGTVSLRGVLGDIVSFSFGVTGESPEFGDKGNSPELEDFNGNLNLLTISYYPNRVKLKLTDQVSHPLLVLDSLVSVVRQ